MHNWVETIDPSVTAIQAINRQKQTWSKCFRLLQQTSLNSIVIKKKKQEIILSASHSSDESR
jgi:ribosomal protein L25 (general stress protein Ctc)